MTAIKNPEFESLISHVLTLAKKAGATQAEVSVNSGKGFSTNVRMGEVETLEHHRDKSLDVTVYINQKTGSVSTSDLQNDALQLTVEKACHIAKFANEDPYAGLADKKLMAFDYPNLDLYHIWNISPDKAIQLALECENFARADKRITNSEGASVSTHDYLHAYGNTHGFIGSYPTSCHNISLALIAAKSGEMQRDYDYTSARDPHTLVPITILANHAVERTVRRLGARKINTQQCPVIFTHDIAKSLISSFLTAIRGGRLYRKASFLLDHLDKQIFPDFVSILEDPHLPKALGSVPFDSEGVRTSKKAIIENGILKTYLLGAYSARKLGMQSTGNAGGAHNIFVTAPDCDFSALLKQINKGLLVTELIGSGTNLVTGDYSRGAFGFWVENSEIQFPVQEITIAGNLKDMLRGILAVGNDIDMRGNIHTGSILIEKMTLAGH